MLMRFLFAKQLLNRDSQRQDFSLKSVAVCSVHNFPPLYACVCVCSRSASRGVCIHGELLQERLLLCLIFLRGVQDTPAVKLEHTPVA